jgi:hypothetical protein
VPGQRGSLARHVTQDDPQAGAGAALDGGQTTMDASRTTVCVARRPRQVPTDKP